MMRRSKSSMGLSCPVPSPRNPNSSRHSEFENPPCSGRRFIKVFDTDPECPVGEGVEPCKGAENMGIGLSIFLIAVGAILAFAVNVTTTGFNLNTIGWILMGVGVLGIVLSMVFWSTWGGWRRRDTYVVDGPESGERRTIVR
jgi:hypothetical protein